MKLFDKTKWEVLETYLFDGAWFVVQVRMNNRNGFKEFHVKRITGNFHFAHCTITPEKINAVTTK